jgi:hypothetical protein
MNATQTRTTSARRVTTSGPAKHGSTYIRLAGVRSRRRNVEPPAQGGPSSEDVVGLIDAAGPLTADDIAGGLDVSLSETFTRLQSMVNAGCVQQDEWSRYRLWGSCRES